MPPKKAKEEVKAQEKTAKSPEDDSNLMGAIAYIVNLFVLPWSLALYLMKKEDKFVRFHALQAAALWLVAVAVSMVMSFAVLAISVVTSGIGSFGFLCMPVIGLAFLALDLYPAYMAYQGQKFKLPVIGDFVEKYV
jgi:uncharacterized membrane protein